MELPLPIDEHRWQCAIVRHGLGDADASDASDEANTNDGKRVTPPAWKASLSPVEAATPLLLPVEALGPVNLAPGPPLFPTGLPKTNGVHASQRSDNPTCSRDNEFFHTLFCPDEDRTALARAPFSAAPCTSVTCLRHLCLTASAKPDECQNPAITSSVDYNNDACDDACDGVCDDDGKMEGLPLLGNMPQPDAHAMASSSVSTACTGNAGISRDTVTPGLLMTEAHKSCRPDELPSLILNSAYARRTSAQRRRSLSDSSTTSSLSPPSPSSSCAAITCADHLLRTLSNMQAGHYSHLRQQQHASPSTLHSVPNLLSEPCLKSRHPNSTSPSLPPSLCSDFFEDRPQRCHQRHATSVSRSERPHGPFRTQRDRLHPLLRHIYEKLERVAEGPQKDELAMVLQTEIGPALFPTQHYRLCGENVFVDITHDTHVNSYLETMCQSRWYMCKSWRGSFLELAAGTRAGKEDLPSYFSSNDESFIRMLLKRKVKARNQRLSEHRRQCKQAAQNSSQVCVCMCTQTDALESAHNGLVRTILKDYLGPALHQTKLLMNLHIVYEGPFRCVPEDTVFFRPEELEEEKRAHSKRATSLDTSSRDGSKSANSCPPHPCKRSKAATL